MADEHKPAFTIENNILKGMIYPITVNYFSLGDFVLKQMAKNLEHDGQHDIESGQIYSFRKMKDLTVRCALWMIKQGIKQNDIVVLCTHNHVDTFIPFLATLCTGAIFNAWYHDMDLSTTKYFMKFMKPKIIFTNKYCIDTIEEAARNANCEPRIVTFEKVTGYDCIYDLLETQSEVDIDNWQCVKPESLEQTAIIIFSSGTTGLPKGVELSHGSILRTMSLVEAGLFDSKRSLSLWYSSMYWISAIILRLMTILMGTTALVHKNFDPDETCSVIEKYKVNWIFLSTSMFHYLYKSNVIDKYDLSSVKQLLVGGAKVNTETIKEMAKALPNASLVQGYGMTEMGGLITSPKPDHVESVGLIAPNVQLKIIDPDTKQVLGPNQIGEICFSSPYMMNGYYQNPEATKNTIDEEGAHMDKIIACWSGWVHSGDLGHYDDNGFIYVVDRIKEILKVKGHHVAPTEIEDLLRKHPAITECAVIGVPHILDNNHPMAFVSVREHSKVTEQDILNLADTFGDLKRLRAGVKFLEKFPYTPSGKVDRKKLRELAKIFLSHDKNYIE